MHAWGQTQNYRVASCGLAESSCSSFRPQDDLQDYAFAKGLKANIERFLREVFPVQFEYHTLAVSVLRPAFFAQPLAAADRSGDLWTNRASDTKHPSDEGSSDRVFEGSSDRTVERSNDQPSVRLNDRATERPFDRSMHPCLGTNTELQDGILWFGRIIL